MVVTLVRCKTRLSRYCWRTPARSSSRLSESHEGWSTSLSKRGLRKPGGYPHHIKRGRNQQMKKSGLGQANVARAPQIPHPNALWKGPLNPRPLGIGLLEHFGGLALTSRNGGFICRALPNSEGSRREELTHCESCGQATQSVWAKRILMTRIPRLSVVGFQMVLVFPRGQVACSASQSMAKQATPKPAAARVCQLLSSRIGPSKSTCCSWLVTTWLEVIYPVSTMCSLGSKSCSAKWVWMTLVIMWSATGAWVVSTFVTRC